MHASLSGLDHRSYLTGRSSLCCTVRQRISFCNHRICTGRSAHTGTLVACHQKPDAGRPAWRERTDQVQCLQPPAAQWRSHSSSVASCCLQAAQRVSALVNSALDQFDSAVMPRERVSFSFCCMSLQSGVRASQCAHAGGHQGPDADGAVPGSTGAFQHAAIPCICTFVQCCWL